MSKARLAVVLLAAAGGLAAAALAGAGVFSGARRIAAAEGSSPSCLPATLQHSARLAGVPVDVSPAPRTDTANPHAQISFLGVPATEIRDVSVRGEASGGHPGRLVGYSQQDGASFLPAQPFDPGEQVEVSALIGHGSAARRVAFSFGVDVPYATNAVGGFPNPPAPPADYQSFATLPGAQPPVLTVTAPDRDPAAGDILTTSGPGTGQYGPLIYTPQGRLVWFDRLAGGLSAEDLSVQRFDGHHDLTLWEGRVLSLGFGEGEDLVMNSNYRVVARIPGANGLQADLHDFQLAGDGVAYITAFNPIRCNLTSAGGSRNGVILDTAIMEIDIRSGLVRWEWHSLDHVGVGESNAGVPAGATPWDWFHLNSIDPEPNGNILISARSTWAAYQLEGGSGDIIWRLGGNRSSFKMGAGTETAWQHDARLLPDGEVTLFDDGSNPPVHHQSRAVRIALDGKTGRARLSASYVHPDPLLSVSQGNMQTLPDGNTVVDYGAIPELTEYAPGGALLFDAHLPYDMDSYRGFRFPWSGRPLSAPAVMASLNSTGEETIVHASWNGATEVASWRVLGGQRRGSLRAQANAPASGFETTVSLPEKWAYVAVQALDAGGRVLASSPAVPVGAATGASSG